MTRVLLLGSTGSIGTSTCNCIRRFPDRFRLVGLSTNNNAETLINQAAEFSAEAVCACSARAASVTRDALPSSVRHYQSTHGLVDLVNGLDFDILLNALVGAAGFPPTVAALKRKKRIALANKESLVIGGDLITDLIDRGYGNIIPVDSEHSAIYQCANGEDRRTIESLTLTASGGPFRDTPLERFADLTPEDALRHPTWEMGRKITIDSATMMNKGFEVIEAHHLFGMPYDRLKIVVHPQSIMHSMVTFHDGSIIAQCGLPDMELPIQYALSFPDRLPIEAARLDLSSVGALTFLSPDLERFPCLKLCLDAGAEGGTCPTVLNAANEVAVHQFLEHRISFDRIPVAIEQALTEHTSSPADSEETIGHADRQAREAVLRNLQSL